MKRIEILSEYKCRYLFRVCLRVTDIISTKISLKLRSALDDKTVIETKLSYFLHQIHLSALFSELLHVMYIESSSPHMPIKSFRLRDTNIKFVFCLEINYNTSSPKRTLGSQRSHIQLHPRLTLNHHINQCPQL
jgi:hypothetical protein